jgi:hypothetical protein
VKTFGNRFSSLALPAIVLIALVSIGVVDFRLPTALFWSLVIATLVILLLWQLSVRRSYAPLAQSLVLEDQISALSPYAIAYAAYCIGLVAAMACTWYFELSPTFLIASLAAWLVRRDFWAAMILRGLKRTDELRLDHRPQKVG